MTKREIIIAPDARLKVISKPVEAVTDEVRALMDDMLETMYAAPGIGLAAVQVGVPIRVIVLDLARDGEERCPRFFINPEILESSDEHAFYDEGCLSLPDFYEPVERPAHVRVRHLGYDGDIRETRADDILATCLQHEMDHLEGILFVDHLSKLKRSMILRKLSKQKRFDESA